MQHFRNASEGSFILSVFSDLYRGSASNPTGTFIPVTSKNILLLVKVFILVIKFCGRTETFPLTLWGHSHENIPVLDMSSARPLD